VFKYVLNIVVMLLTRSFQVSGHFGNVLLDCFHVIQMYWRRPADCEYFIRGILMALVIDLNSRRHVLPSSDLSSCTWSNLFILSKFIRTFVLATPMDSRGPSQEDDEFTTRPRAQSGSVSAHVRFGDTIGYGIHWTEEGSCADRRVLETLSVLLEALDESLMHMGGKKGSGFRKRGGLTPVGILKEHLSFSKDCLVFMDAIDVGGSSIDNEVIEKYCKELYNARGAKDRAKVLKTLLAVGRWTDVQTGWVVVWDTLVQGG